MVTNNEKVKLIGRRCYFLYILKREMKEPFTRWLYCKRREERKRRHFFNVSCLVSNGFPGGRTLIQEVQRTTEGHLLEIIGNYESNLFLWLKSWRLIKETRRSKKPLLLELNLLKNRKPVLIATFEAHYKKTSIFWNNKIIWTFLEFSNGQLLSRREN